MAASDKTKNVTHRAKGKAKEVTGKVTGNDSLRRKGRNDQTKAHAKQAGEKIRDTLKS